MESKQQEKAAPEDQIMGDHDTHAANKGTNQDDGKDNLEIKDEKVETITNETPNEDISDEEVEPVCEVDPKEWRQMHDKWLHAAMCTSMGDPTLTSIPDIDNVERVERKSLATNLTLQLA